MESGAKSFWTEQFVNPPGLSRPSGHEGLSSLVYDSQGVAPSAKRRPKETAAVVHHATNENLEGEQARLAMSAEAGVRQVEEDEEETADKASDGETLPDVSVVSSGSWIRRRRFDHIVKP